MKWRVPVKAITIFALFAVPVVSADKTVGKSLLEIAETTEIVPFPPLVFIKPFVFTFKAVALSAVPFRLAVSVPNIAS